MATYKVGADGKAQSGLKAGDEVVTAGGTYKITGVNPDGTYQSTLTNKNQTTNNYTGGYANGSSGGNKTTTSSTTANKTYSTGDAYTSDGTTKRPVAGQGADVSRHPELAGQSVYRDGYVHHYDEDGYLKYAEKSESPNYAGHTDPTKANQGYTTNQNMWTDEQILSAADLQKIADLRAQGAAGIISWAEANAQANAIRQGYGYTIDQNGTVVDQQAKDRAEAAQQNTGATQYYDKGTGTYKPIVSAPQTNVAGQQGAVQAPSIGVQQGGVISGQQGGTGAGITVPSVSAPATSLRDYLDQWLEAAKKQQELTIDRGTGLAVNELSDAQKEAEAQYQTQRDQIAEDEAKAKDNQALYAERRGDRGGIGAAQYDSIMNTAAQNRLAVNSAQTKLASDTAKEIAQLRAQGEYEKADAMLTLTQQYLAQLMSLEQWSLEYGLSAAQFQASLEQWAKEYELSLADITGIYNGQLTLKGQQYQDSLLQDQRKQLASAGEALLSAGILPSASQLEALGMTSAQAQDYLTAVQLAAAAKKSSGSGSGSGSGSYKPKLTQPQVVSAIEDGMVTAQVKKDYEYYFGERYVDESEYDEYGNTRYTSLDYDEGDGIITWNGRKYTSVQQFLDDVESAKLSTLEMQALEKKLKAYGFQFA